MFFVKGNREIYQVCQPQKNIFKLIIRSFLIMIVYLNNIGNKNGQSDKFCILEKNKKNNFAGLEHSVNLLAHYLQCASFFFHEQGNVEQFGIFR